MSILPHHSGSLSAPQDLAHERQDVGLLGGASHRLGPRGEYLGQGPVLGLDARRRAHEALERLPRVVLTESLERELP